MESVLPSHSLRGVSAAEQWGGALQSRCAASGRRRKVCAAVLRLGSAEM